MSALENEYNENQALVQEDPLAPQMEEALVLAGADPLVGEQSTEVDQEDTAFEEEGEVLVQEDSDVNP